MYTIQEDLLLDNGGVVPFAYSPNFSGDLRPRFIIGHYTAGGTAEGAVSWLTNPDARASAHLVIGRDTDITQLVPFDKIAWHAGMSTWNGLVGLNSYSIGIELDNAGRLQLQNGVWKSWWGRVYDASEVLVAEHEHGGGVCGWHTYPEAQIQTALDVCVALARHYEIEDMLGHDDISPGRKTDPGPAFPMASFKAKVMGRRPTEEGPDWEAMYQDSQVEVGRLDGLLADIEHLAKER